MHTWQLPLLGLPDFPAELSDFEIAYFFSFSATEQHAITGDHSKVGASCNSNEFNNFTRKQENVRN